jgi:hypothetical protein
MAETQPRTAAQKAADDAAAADTAAAKKRAAADTAAAKKPTVKVAPARDPSLRTRESDKHPQRRATDAQPSQAATPVPSINQNDRLAESPEQVQARLDAHASIERIKVQATKMGYYDDKLRRPGDVFTIVGKASFSEKWMQRVDGGTPEKITGSAEDLRRQHDEIQAGRLSGKGGETAPNPATGTGDPLGAAGGGD